MASKTKSSGTSGIDLRQKLTADFVAALQADWAQYGAQVIELLRTKAPTRYAEIVSRLITPEPMPADPYANVNSVEDIGRALLSQVGLEAPREDQIERAIAENDKFAAALGKIAAS